MDEHHGMRFARRTLMAAAILSATASPSPAGEAPEQSRGMLAPLVDLVSPPAKPAAPAEEAQGKRVDVAMLRGVPTANAALSGRNRHKGLSTKRAAMRAGFRSLSDITGGAYPAFTPGIGAVYVRRDSMPNGPYLAFDRRGRLVSTIYKFSQEKMVEKSPLEAHGTDMPPVDHVSGRFGDGHPGVDFPHYSLVFWHVPPGDEARVAK